MIDHLRGGVLLPDAGGPGDGDLLGRFIDRRDEAALAVLVRRHGPMVWGVCRRLLGHHDAEDAFQATFLVLVRKAVSVAPRESVGNWLYGVAHQTALQARRAAGRRRAREVQVMEMPEAVGPDQGPDLLPILDEELSRLPDKYRAVIVLCDLEERTRTEAARQLGVPDGTVAGRLSRARALLARRLARRGVTLSAGALAAALSPNAASADVPALMVSSTIKAASLFAAGHAPSAGAVSVKVAALTEGVLKTMFLSRFKSAVVTTTLFVAALAAGFGAWAAGGAPLDDRPAPPQVGGTSSKPASSTVTAIIPRPVKALARGEKRVNLITAQLAIFDHGVDSGCRVYSAGVEVENLSGHSATIHFEPKDLKLELLDADGKRIAEGPSVRSGPAPMAHDATIPTGGYVALSTHRGGIGLSPNSVLFAAGFQDWRVKPGTYRLRGTVAVTVKFGDARLDPEKPEPLQDQKDGKVRLELSERRFEVKGP